ncbi:MAG: type VI secretion system-associated FHA domain protein TagH [Gammaproteobacteria bacterium]|nr:MAG: type VI secretion system-associated FHA domain protein TagH [Gammaproteobacteria bacterium]
MDSSLVRGTMLKLRIVSDQGRSLAERSSATFSVEGGTIGRSADNDWVLPDPLRYVSAHHARVQFREGHFYLQDVSTNGVYVNDDMEPLATRGSGGYRLADGDVLRMGEYHIVAALEARPAQDEAGAAVPTSIHALHTLGRHEPDIGASLDLDALLLPANQAGSILPVNAYGQSVDSGRVRALKPKARAERAPEVPLLDGASAQSLGQQMARLAEAVGREPKIGVSAFALEDARAGLDAFCRGAGVEPERLPGDAQVRLLHLAGRLFREALVGFKDLERTRTDTRNRHRIEFPPREPDDPRPSLANSVVEELIVELLVQHSSNSSAGSIRPSSRRASSAPRAAATRAPPTKRSTGSCSPPSIAISSRCRRTTCRTPSSRRSPRRIAKHRRNRPRENDTDRGRV